MYESALLSASDLFANIVRIFGESARRTRTRERLPLLPKRSYRVCVAAFEENQLVGAFSRVLTSNVLANHQVVFCISVQLVVSPVEIQTTSASSDARTSSWILSRLSWSLCLTQLFSSSTCLCSPAQKLEINHLADQSLLRPETRCLISSDALFRMT